MTTVYRRWRPDRFDEQGLPWRDMGCDPYDLPSGMDTLPEVGVEDLKWFFRQALTVWRWKFATTMMHIPHHYIVRGRHVKSDEDWKTAFAVIMHYGVDGTFNGRKRVYLYAPDDQTKWWAMTNYVEQSRIINKVTRAQNEKAGLPW